MAAYPLLDLLPPTRPTEFDSMRHAASLMRWFETLWYRSSALRLAARGVVLVLAAWPLIVIALKLQPEMALLSARMVVVTVVGFVLIEASLFMGIQLLFRKVK